MTISKMPAEITILASSDDVAIACLVWCLIILLQGFFLGAITDSIAKKKGYKSGFAWGFFLSFIGLIIVACYPDLNAQNKMLQAPEHTSADELMKYKELLDQGAITQREFDAKKRQLLNLDPQPKQASHNPAPKQMGKTEWYCKKCYTKNAAYSMICTKCGASRAEQAAALGYRDTKY